MGVPRIIFTRFASIHSLKLRPWHEHRRRVIDDHRLEPDQPETDGSIVVWQLVTANNRELARGASVFADFITARRSVTDQIRAATESRAVPVSDEQRGGYGWYLTVGERPAVICSRWYVADRERRQAMELAVATISMAKIALGARQYAEWQSTSVRSVVR
jgi:hypothetical protein